MRSEQEARYLERFKTLTPQEKREDFLIALRFLLNIIAEKEQGRRIAPTALEGNVIDGEYTIGGAE